MSLYLDDGDVRLYHGDALEQLALMPSEGVQCIVTSPPYLGLRDYGNDTQIGLEPTIAEYVGALVGVFAEARRVLRSDGVFWLNVGDSYNAYNGGAGPGSKLSLTQTEARPRLSSGFGLQQKELKPKDLMLIPARLAIALQDDGWYVRADVIWSKPNPMPESVTDRPSKAHEYVFLLSKRARYFFDADAISTPATDESVARAGRNSRYDDQLVRDAVPYAAARPRVKQRTVREGIDVNGGGQGNGEMTWGARANPRSVWTIPTEPTPFKHFATMPTELARRCVAAGSRIGDTVLDPFMGSGTTALAARRLGRQAVGIELNADYLAISARRLQQLSLLGGTEALDRADPATNQEREATCHPSTASTPAGSPPSPSSSP